MKKIIEKIKNCSGCARRREVVKKWQREAARRTEILLKKLKKGGEKCRKK